MFGFVVAMGKKTTSGSLQIFFFGYERDRNDRMRPTISIRKCSMEQFGENEELITFILLRSQKSNPCHDDGRGHRHLA